MQEDLLVGIGKETILASFSEGRFFLFQYSFLATVLIKAQ